MSFLRYMSYSDCPQMFQDEERAKRERLCRKCGTPLAGKKLTWCSTECSSWWNNNHWVSYGRRSLLEMWSVFPLTLCDANEGWWGCPRDKPHAHALGVVCTRCGDFEHGRREVNHIIRAMGSHSIASCLHHHENLEPLCEPCHRELTNEQLRADAEARRVLNPPPPPPPPTIGHLARERRRRARLGLRQPSLISTATEPKEEDHANQE